MARVSWFTGVALSFAVACGEPSIAPTDGGREPSFDATPEGDARTQSDAAAHDAAGDSAIEAASDTTPLAACRRYFEAMCDRFLACNLHVACTQADGCPDVMFAPGSNWTAEKARACKAEWAKVSCEDLALGKRPSCDALPGSFEVGHSCIARMQCQSGACSESVLIRGKCGECATIAVPGGTCDTTTLQCPHGQYCDRGTCVPIPRTPHAPYSLAAGQECTSLRDCQVDLGCSVMGDAGTGVCLALPSIDEPCLLTFNGVRTCAKGAGCDRAKLTCQALPGAGEPCVSRSCDEESYCMTQLPSSSSPEGLCVRKHAAGEFCTEEHFLYYSQVSSRTCADGLQCMRQPDVTAPTVCATPRELGESCDGRVHLCRYGTHCDAGACAENTESRLYDILCETP